MENNNTTTEKDICFSSQKKEWKRPELSVIGNEIVQGSIFSGNDGNPGPTGS